MSTGNQIVDTAEIAEDEWDGNSEPDELVTDMSTTKAPENTGMEFHVQMRGYTLRDMDTLIVEAAARLIVGKRGDAALAKQIEERCMALVTAKIDAKLATITAEIIDQPVTPNFGDKKPVTMRELIGLYGKEYLTENVDSDGKPAASSSRYQSHFERRITWMVGKALQSTFQAEITKATNAAIMDVQNAIRAEHNALLAQEKARVRDAIAKVTA